VILDYGNHKPFRTVKAIQVDLTGDCDVRIGYVLPFKDETFDIVISNQVMEHNFHIESYYREAARVLKPFGYLFLHFPHRWQPNPGHYMPWFSHWFRKTDGYVWKSKRYHKKVARPYFPVWIDLAPPWRQVKAVLFKTDLFNLLR